MNILEELWYGNVMPNDRDENRDRRLRKLNALITRNEDKLVPFLPEQAKEIYEKLRENQAEYGCLSECEAFCIGFRMGARITYEVMDRSDLPSIDD